jgi:nucleotide-binding universal stress UspA family protein
MATISYKHLVAAVDVHRAVDPQPVDQAVVDSVVAHTISLALAYSARVTLLHVVQDDSMALLAVDSPAMAPTYEALVEGVEQRHADARIALAALEARLRDAGVACDADLFTDAEPVADALVKRAVGLGGDLLVLATHGRRGLRRMVLGSVAERAAHLAPMPVLLVPPPVPPARTG